MKSNYPRSDRAGAKRNLNLIVGALALAGFLHAFFAVFFPNNPGIELIRYIPQNARMAVSVTLWISLIAWGISAMGKSAPWKFWRKVRLALLSGLFTALIALVLDQPNRRGYWFYDGDPALIAFGSLAMAIFAMLLSTPIWVGSAIIRKRDARRATENLPSAMSASEAGLRLNEPMLVDSVKPGVEQRA
ncbi:MAG TPA: hypothetical protein VK171_11405 [Fimbriimonas sp.]|nr:hypothetical protein [Fimbriimonas sp.]